MILNLHFAVLIDPMSLLSFMSLYIPLTSSVIAFYGDFLEAIKEIAIVKNLFEFRENRRKRQFQGLKEE